MLITKNEDPHMLLGEKMRQIHLRVGHGQRALERVQLQHIESLTSLLTLLRARWMIKNKQDPFNSVSIDYRKDFAEILDENYLVVTGEMALGKLKDLPNLDDVLYKFYLFIVTRL